MGMINAFALKGKLCLRSLELEPIEFTWEGATEGGLDDAEAAVSARVSSSPSDIL